MRSAKFKTIYNRISYGVRVGQWDMRYDDFKNIKLFLPPISEQNQIVKYLDFQLAKINKFIQAKKKLIAVLKEQKQAVINEAVTKGLNSSVIMKQSGIEWLGDIPQHWNRNKITRLFKEIGSGTTPKSGVTIYYNNGSINWINSGDLNDGYLQDTKNKVTPKAMSDYSVLKLYPENTIVLAMYGATIGKLSISKIEACCNQACCSLGNLVDNMNLEYVFYSLMSCRKYLIEQSKGGGQPNISQDIVKSTWLPIPPKDEQQRIVEYIKKELNTIEKAIYKVEREIELITEYRICLVSDVVTGKVDVQHLEFDYYNPEDNLNIEDFNEVECELEEVIKGEECEV